MGTDSGAMALAYYQQDARFSMFLADVEDSIKHIKTMGAAVGENFPFLSEFQNLLWSSDSYDNIVREFSTYESETAGHE